MNEDFARNINNTLNILTRGVINPIVEIRILKAGFDSTVSGYYDSQNFEKIPKDILKYNGKYNIYLTINEVDANVKSRSYNKLKVKSENTTKDNEIICRRKLLIDCDPKRPSGISSTAEEKELARLKLDEVISFLGSASNVLVQSLNMAKYKAYKIVFNIFEALPFFELL